MNLMSVTFHYKINIWYSYALQEFVYIFLRLCTKLKIQFYLSKVICFGHIVLGIYVENSVHAGNFCRNPVHNKYVK